MGSIDQAVGSERKSQFVSVVAATSASPSLATIGRHKKKKVEFLIQPQ